MKCNRKTPCFECPFLKSSPPEYFGPYTAAQYFNWAHGAGVPCHLEGSHVCVGSVQHANASGKLYSDPIMRRIQRKLGTNPLVLNLREFIDHHMGGKFQPLNKHGR